MSKFLSFKANDPQSEVRKIITDNFSKTTSVPEDKTTPGKLHALVGVNSPGAQELYHAKDGQDYLSPDTGVMKDNPGDQTIQGSLTVDGLTVSDGGAIIADHLYVYDTNAQGAPSFTVSKNKATVCYGTLEAKNTVVVRNRLTVDGGINSTGQANNFGNSNFLDINATGTGNINRVETSSMHCQIGTVDKTLWVGQGFTANSTATINGATTFNNHITMSNPGDISISYVRPLRTANRAPNNGEIAYGTLWGQY